MCSLLKFWIVATFLMRTVNIYSSLHSDLPARGRCTRSAFFHTRTRFRALYLTLLPHFENLAHEMEVTCSVHLFSVSESNRHSLLFMLRERQGQTLPQSGTNKLQNPDFRQVLTGLKHMSMLFDATPTRNVC